MWLSSESPLNGDEYRIGFEDQKAGKAEPEGNESRRIWKDNTQQKTGGEPGSCPGQPNGGDGDRFEEVVRGEGIIQFKDDRHGHQTDRDARVSSPSRDRI